MEPEAASTRTRSNPEKWQKESMARPYDDVITEATFSGTKELGVEKVDELEEKCFTPKGKRFRIPEMLTCPPAPKKRRSVTFTCSSKRSPIAFFASPDLELFFLSPTKFVSTSSSV
ncbi:hypothetical protein RJT34_23944 [Clitoria ternatea]|uniref:Uncharacterized protein n=1 Tax=Clitoria ternatea TaxID=43366 RepID=A0AAN9IIU7_CLITE